MRCAALKYHDRAATTGTSTFRVFVVVVVAPALFAIARNGTRSASQEVTMD